MSSTVDIEFVYSNLVANSPISVRLSEARYTIPADGLALQPTPSPDADSDMESASLNGLTISPDTLTVIPGDTANFSITIGVEIQEGASSLQGHVIIGGADATVTIYRIGSQDSDEATMSRPFSISLR